MDLLGSLLDAGEFVLVIVNWQVQPAAEVVAGTSAFAQFLVSGVNHCLHFLQFVFVNKRSQFTTVKTYYTIH